MPRYQDYLRARGPPPSYPPFFIVACGHKNRLFCHPDTTMARYHENLLFTIQKPHAHTPENHFSRRFSGPKRCDKNDLQENVEKVMPKLRKNVCFEHFHPKLQPAQNREDSSDLDDSLTETFAATKSIVSKFFWYPRGPKTLKNLGKTSKVLAKASSTLRESFV